MLDNVSKKDNIVVERLNQIIQESKMTIAE